jgi:hypothetical protein
MAKRLLLASLATALLLSVNAARAEACPFCNATGTTLLGEVAQADFILYGTLSNAKPDPNDPTAFNKGTTDLTIEKVIKSHEFIKDKKKITIPKYLPPETGGKEYKYLIYFNVINGQMDPYRGEPFSPDSKLPDYLAGAIEVKQKDAATRLRYFFDYLESPDLAISGDAYGEFANADYKEIREVAAKLPAELIIKWLKDPNTRGSRFGLYGLVLGHCGTSADAKAIRALLDDKDRSYTSGLDGVVTGYIMLAPTEGWDYLLKLINDTSKDFAVRYAALKTARFFWEYRPDLVPNSRVLEAMKVLAANPEIADMPIEDLRKWKVWELTPLVLGYAKQESHNSIKIINRAILKFAVAASVSDPKNTAAVEFVKDAKAKDPKGVEYIEELLKEELKPAISSNKKDTNKTGG